MVSELVENGLKFSNENSSVAMEGYSKEGFYFLSVSDSGRGMSKNEIQSISAFNKFGEDKLSEHGLGLGLSIIKKITELHNGSFRIHSESGKGTTCEVAFPI